VRGVMRPAYELEREAAENAASLQGLLAVVIVILAALLAVGCSSTPKLPIDAQCSPLCKEQCPTAAQAGVTWAADPEDPAAWDALGGDVVPALVDLNAQCEVRRRACEQCLQRLDRAGLIRF